MAITVLIMGNTNIFTSTSFASGIVDHGQSGFAAACDLKGCITSHDNSGGQSGQDGNGLSLSCFAVLGVQYNTLPLIQIVEAANKIKNFFLFFLA